MLRKNVASNMQMMLILASRLANLQVPWPRKPSKRSYDRPVGKVAMENKQENRTTKPWLCDRAAAAQETAGSGGDIYRWPGRNRVSVTVMDGARLLTDARGLKVSSK